MQLDPAPLAALAAIQRTGSFETAAAQLGVTPSAISQRVKALEERMGVVLVIRAQPCQTTPAGARLVQHAENIALMEAAVLHDLAPATAGQPPLVRLAVNADSLATWLVPALAQVPQMLFDLVIDDQDHASDWLRRGAVSAAVTGRDDPVPGCTVTALGSLRYVATASPAFVARWFGDGVTADALAHAPMMTFDAKDKLQGRWAAQVTGASIAPPTHGLPSTHAFVDAALAGLGWGMNPETLVRPHLDSGALVALHPGHPLDVPLYWQVSRLLQPALQPLSRALRAAAAASLRPMVTQT